MLSKTFCNLQIVFKKRRIREREDKFTSVTFLQNSRVLFYFCSGEGWEAVEEKISLSLE